MEFLGVGYQELLIVLALMLIVVGPERMPRVAYQIGRAVRQLQLYARAVRDEFKDEIDYLEDQYKTVKGEVDSAQRSMRDQQRAFQTELSTALPSDTLATNVLPFPEQAIAAPAESLAEEPAAPAAVEPAPPAEETKAPLVF